ncbi:DUF3892 domain-containing protein [Iamia majanohamensis]|uniref:DUF3892 domain-containing protein n=1 Tax=Iamia majanohamensis TaxID=467976 RepID=A0AAE9YD02_9ACTN|nr:DUF3892 domain-containing protein [Iamia majanohamensis]WCO66557.1 DUF3892 domain-containing protein [Iamia majanohamensis]
MDRRVTKTGKDSEGDITSLCGAWGSTSKATAIREIEASSTAYYVQDIYSRRADVHVVAGATGKYLRTDPNSSCSDNLDSLPAC